MEPLRVLIVDDEAPARRKVRRFLEGMQDVEVVGEVGDGPAAVEEIRERRPDVVVLDIQMPGMGGFEVLEALDPAELPQVVFATAFDEHAIRAFEVHAVDYLLKPFDRVRFEKALARARERRGRGEEALLARLRDLLDARGSGEARAGTEGAPLERILVDHRGRSLVVPVERVDWFEADGNYVSIHVGGRSHLVRSTLSSMEERLDPARFRRVHRSAIVNLDRVVELRPEGHGDATLVLADGAEVPLSRRYRARLGDALGAGG